MSSPQPVSSLSPSRGPFATALVAAIVSTALLVANLAGMPTTLTTVICVTAPGMGVGALAVALSMGWIFLLVGRQHRPPSRLKWTAGLLIVSMVEMLTLILLILRVHTSV